MAKHTFNKNYREELTHVDDSESTKRPFGAPSLGNLHIFLIEVVCENQIGSRNYWRNFFREKPSFWRECDVRKNSQNSLLCIIPITPVKKREVERKVGMWENHPRSLLI